MESVGSPVLWGLFAALVVSVLAIDLGVFNRSAKEVSQREALAWTCVWFGLALSFNYFVLVRFGPQRAAEFLQAWIIEQTLSVDNIFVFLVIFKYFAVPRNLQHRVLFWGILGAVFARGLFIFVGAALIERFHGVMYVFGAILLYTSWKLLFQGESEEMKMERNLMLRLFRRFVPTLPDYRGAAFLVKEGGKTWATPLLCVLVVVEATDVVFAVDSIPAVFGITTDVFIVYTSNIFAILGLRSLTFLIAGALDRFHYLKYGLALVLAFIGTKILIASIYKVPSTASLIVVVAILAGAVLSSLLRPQPARPNPEPSLEREDPN